jgi:hypothetical protein
MRPHIISVEEKRKRKRRRNREREMKRGGRRGRGRRTVNQAIQKVKGLNKTGRSEDRDE